jgi:phage gp29-like protein
VIERASIIHREVPLITVGTGWDVSATRHALEQVVIGLFDFPAQLVDSMFGDSRLQAAMSSRTGGLLGRPVDFVLPRKYRDSSAAKECRDAFVDAWPTMAAEAAMGDLQRWAVMLGFGLQQLLWDPGGDYAVPHLRPWHPRYTYWHWSYRCLAAITQDGLQAVTPGDGKWLLHAPHGEAGYRGWMHGAMRAIAPWWLARHYALRDWARYSERHGLPMILGKSPARGDPVQIAAWRTALANLGQENVINLPQNVDGASSYGLELLEASDMAWEGFPGLIKQCDTEITLALLAQNLTTEVKEGSFAAARVHADVRQALLEADARALSGTIWKQLAQPFAAWNFSEPDLAPRVLWNVKPYEDDETAARTLLTFTQALVNLRNSGLALTPDQVTTLAHSFGLDIGQLKAVEPLIGGKLGGGAGGEKEAAQARGKRFAALLEDNRRLRVRLGETPSAEIEAEHAALLEAMAEDAVPRANVPRFVVAARDDIVRFDPRLGMALDRV